MQNEGIVKYALKDTTKFKAMDTAKLSIKTGLCPQSLRHSINKLRSIGIPICVSPNGYYIERDRKAVARYANELELKATGVLRAVEGLKRYAKLGLKK